jgi:uncharacterized membrane protein (DUF485 family)
MENDVVQKIKQNPHYRELVSSRSSFSWLLTFFMMVVYYGFILLTAFNKEFLATKIGSGVTTYGMPIGLFVIVFTIVITGIYVNRANNKFDDLTAKLRAEVEK